jgi:enamine deaminase RidA (YjgF/YER057c/UK114 family)
VTRASGPRLYVSGTASIRRSESCHPGDVTAQCGLAITNMDLVAQAAGLPALTAGPVGRASFRVYLRDPVDWPVVRTVFEQRLRCPPDAYTVLQADICRRELLVELEACVDGVLPAD